MSLIEFIGFLISLFALLFLFMKQKMDQRRRSLNPEKYEQEEAQREDALKKLLNSLKTDIEEIRHDVKNEKRMASPPPPPPVVHKTANPKRKEHPQRTVQDQYQYKSKIEDYRPKNVVEERQLKTNINQQFDSYGNQIVSEDLTLATDEVYKIQRANKPSRLQNYLRNLPSQRDMLIYQEVLGRPKALRQFIESYDYPGT